MRVLFDESDRRLIAWGVPKDHETLKATLEKLEGQQPTDQPVQVEVYRITQLDPQSLKALVESLFPHLEFTIDANTRTLIVAATPEDLLAIRNLLEQLQPTEQRPDSPTLKVVPLKEPAPSELTKMLQSLRLPLKSR